MRWTHMVGGALLVGAMAFSVSVRADDGDDAAGGARAGADVAGGDAAGGDAAGGDDAKKKVEEKRILRARRLVATLQAAYDAARNAETIDEELLARLEEALKEARVLTRPITAPELTDPERKALEKAFDDEKKANGEDAEEEDEEPAVSEWAQRAIDRAFEDVGLTEEQEVQVTPILADYYAAVGKAWRDGDSKAQSAIKKTRDKALKKAVGRKKAQKIINNLNSGGWGGRGGGGR